MAYIPNGPNLNARADAGNFETDISTWGIPVNTPQFALSRNYGQAVKGNYSVQSNIKLSSFTSGQYSTGVLGVVLNASEEYYYVKVWVKVPSIAPPASDDTILQIKCLQPVSEVVDQRVTKTVAQAKLDHEELIAVFHRDTTDTVLSFLVYMVDAGGSTVNVDGRIYSDDFTIHAALDDTVTCDIAVDVENTVVTEESGLGNQDGSIVVAVSGGDAPFEYSKDDGDNWQTSNQFLGLSYGLYKIKVREQNNTDCVAAADIFVNFTGSDFDFTTQITHETITGAANGQIVVNVTGAGTTPFLFSKDGGLTQQSSNIFTGLPAGTYVIVVTDDNGNGESVAKNVTVNAGQVIFEKIYFSENPIFFTVPNLGDGSGENYRNYLEVRVQDIPGGPFNKKFAAAVELDSNNQSRFSIQPAFRGVFEISPPAKNASSIVQLTDRIKLYKNYYKFTQDDEETPASFISSNPFKIIYGGLDKKKFANTNYFYTYLPTNKKFMSWQPPVKEVDEQQEDYLQFWAYALQFTTVKLMAKVYYDDATDVTQQITSSPVTFGLLYQLPAGPANSGVSLINPAKNIIKYDLWLRDQSDVDITEVKTYQLTPFRLANTRYFLFLTSLGAFEVVRSVGLSERSVIFSGDVVERHLPENYSATDGQYKSTNKTRQFDERVSSGFIVGKYADQWLDYMQDFLISPQVYDITSGERVPVIIQAKQMSRKSDRDNKRFVRFEVQEAYRHSVYTPEII